MIGADRYRKLTKKAARASSGGDEVAQQLTIGVAGARAAGKSRLIEALSQATSGDLSILKARLESSGLEPDIVDRMRTARWIEAPGYTSNPLGENARDRSTRRHAVKEAVEADLLLIVIDGRRDVHNADVAFAQALDQWYVSHPAVEVPPTLVVVTGVDSPEFGGDWKPPYDWSLGHSPREVAVRSRLDSIRAILPPTVGDIVAVGLAVESPYGILEHVLPSLASLVAGPSGPP